MGITIIGGATTGGSGGGGGGVPATLLGTWAEHLALTGMVDGQVFRFTDSPYEAIYTTEWNYFHKGIKVTPPSLRTWSWFQQGAASVVSAGGVEYLDTGNGSGTFHGRMSAITVPFTVSGEISVVVRETGNSYVGGGLFVANAANELLSIGWYPNGGLYVHKFNANGTTSTTMIQQNYNIGGNFRKFKMADNGTNIIADASIDGINFFNVYTGTRAGSFASGGAATKIGFGGLHDNGNYKVRISLFDLTEILTVG